MANLRNIGGLIKRHYEKALLTLALGGLVYSVVHLYLMKQDEDAKIQEYDKGILKKKTKDVQAVDVESLARALDSAKNPPGLNLGLPHNLLNPVKWQKRPDGTIIKIEKGTEVGPDALKLAKVTPLNTTITIDKASGSGLLMSAMQEASTNLVFRRKLQSFVTTNGVDRTKLFTLRELKGTTDKPEAVIELGGSERVTVTIDTPFTRVDGYKADLQYPPENKAFTDKRVGDVLPLGGEDYNIVAINQNEVVVSAASNKRRTTIRTNAAP
jgi:hypothetical protein